VIILDTHIWVSWIAGGSQLPPNYAAFIQSEMANGLGISAISCWEVAKLVELGRLKLSIPVGQWLNQAISPPIQLLPLTPEIAVESTQLPGSFHRDPSGQLIVATARHYDCPLVTVDRQIRAYAHVRLAP